MQFDAFADLADRYARRIPPALLAGLNGGIAIEEAAHRRDDDPPDVYILGEYVTDEYLGCNIVLYYGSFVKLFGDDEATIREELWDTLRHEVRHHIEERAGLDDLDREDMEQLRRLWER